MTSGVPWRMAPSWSSAVRVMTAFSHLRSVEPGELSGGGISNRVARHSTCCQTMDSPFGTMCTWSAGRPYRYTL